MTTPNIDLYLPKTYLLETKDKAYSDLAYMKQQGNTLDYVYLPKGLSAVTVTATGFDSGKAKVALFGAGGYSAALTDLMSITSATQRLWMGQLSNPGEQSAGLWIKVQLVDITTSGMKNGSVSVQVTNFPPET